MSSIVNEDSNHSADMVIYLIEYSHDENRQGRVYNVVKCDEVRVKQCLQNNPHSEVYIYI